MSALTVPVFPPIVFSGFRLWSWSLWVGLISLLLAGGLSAASAQQVGESWNVRTEAGIRSWQSITSSADGNKLAAIVSGGSLWTSADSGATWTERTEAGSRNWHSITSSADGDKLAAVVSGGGIWTSADSGATWTERTAAGSLNWHSITSSADGEKLAAVVNDGHIWTSTDSGATWTERMGTDSNRYWRSITSSADGSKLAAVVYGGHIWTSADSGTTWTERTMAESKNWNAITSSADGNKLAAVLNGAIWTSIDSGTTWTESLSGGQGWHSITSSANGRKLATVAFNGSIWTSADSGANWTERTAAGSNYWQAITSSADGSKLAAVVYYGGSIWTSEGLPAPTVTLVTPPQGSADGGTEVTITGTGFTEDTEVTFGGVAVTSPTVDSATQITVTTPAHVAGAVSVEVTTLGGSSVANTLFLYVGPAAGVVWTERTDAGNRSWRSITSSADGSKLAAVVNYGGGIWTSADSGATWTERTTAGSRNWLSITSSADGSKLAAMAEGASMWTSTDSGATWTERTLAVPPNTKWTSITSSADGSKLATVGGFLYELYNPDPDVPSSYGVYSYIYTSADSGATWSVSMFTPSSNWTSITSSADGSKLAVVANNGSIATSADTGVTWVERMVAGSETWASITSSADGSQLAAVVEGGSIWTSTNSGVTWTERTAAGSKDWTSITSSADGSRLAAVVQGGNIWTSTDSGTNWTERTAAGSNDWTSITSSAYGSKLAAVSQVIWTSEALSAPTADLSITLTNGVTESVPGTAVSYTLVVTNLGPDAVTAAEVEDLFPASLTGVSWTAVAVDGGVSYSPSGMGDISGLVDLPVGGTVTFDIDATLDIAATGSLSNTATITAPSGVTDPDLTNNSATDTDTIAAVPAVTSLTPASGSTAGGTEVTITGTGFTDATAVTFGGTEGNITDATDTQITVTTPAGSEGAVSVLVTTPGGSNEANTLYTYFDSVVTATPTSPTEVPVTAAGYTATGRTLDYDLGFAPEIGANLTVVNNTSLDFISGEFDNLEQGQTVALNYGGTTYNFVANYYGGSGNDLVLHWVGTRLMAWGANGSGRLGDGSITNRTTPVLVSRTGVLSGKTVIASAAGGYHSMALCSDGTLASWGNNSNGQLGNSNNTSSNVPVLVSRDGVLLGKTIIAVAAGDTHSMALCSDGTLASWGSNTKGQLGDGSTTQRTSPVLVNSAGILAGKTVIAVAAGFEHSLALCADGTVVSWGYNYSGQLGDGSATQRTTPVLVDRTGVLFDKTVIAVAVGANHSMALCSDGTLASWGLNVFGELGDGSTTNRTTPVLVNSAGVLSGKTVIAVAAGGYRSMALCSDGTLASWGDNDYGALGNDDNTSSNVPVLVSRDGVLSGKAVIAVAAGGTHSVALCSDGTLASWGSNNYGQLGDDSTTQRSTPVLVNRANLSFGDRFVAGSSGPTASHSLALVAPSQAPTVTGISPNAGPTAGGQSVTITGTHLAAATAVTFAGEEASITDVTETQITVTTPAGSAGTASVVVTAPTGSSEANTLYTYAPAPTVTSLNISSGPTAGEQSVTITGTNFTGTTAVTFGGTAATGITVNSATQITATTPAGSAGTASVVVTTAGGSNAANTLYTYVSPPMVTSLSPNSGPTAGGQSVVITGTNFTDATAVSFGGTSATSFTVNSATQITATSPAGSAGTASVVVTTAGGSNAANTLYTYVAPPTVTSLSPSSGPTAGGQSVVITGTNLTGASAVTFGGTSATSFTVNSATQITATSPAGSAGAVNVVVTTAGGSATLIQGYTYVTAPTITEISPVKGSTLGGTTVTITGTNFTGATTVTFGSTAATGSTVNSATQITATSPVGSAGLVDVLVTTAGGTATASSAYTYEVPNKAPTDITLSTSTLAENNSAGADVATLSATDEDTTDTHVFTLVTGTGSDDNDSFTITDGVLSIQGIADFETQASYALRIRATDNGVGSLWVEKAVTITITNVNEAPTITDLDDQTILEDENTGALAFTVGDVDASTSLTVTATAEVTAGDALLLPLSGIALTGSGTDTARTLTLTPAANLSGTATITVTVSDGDLSATDTFTLTVTPVNDAPSFALTASDVIFTTEKTVTVAARSGEYSAADFVTDILAGPENESEQEVTFTVTNDDADLFTTPPAVAADGTLTFTPASTGGSATVTVKAVDDGGTENDGVDTSAGQTFTITITTAPELAVFDGEGTDGDARTDNVGTYAFEDTYIGSSSSAQSFTLHNTGTADLTDIVVTSTSTEFVVSGPEETSLEPDATATFTVTFSPTTEGDRTGVISIASNDEDVAEFEINVEGLGVIPPPVITTVTPERGTTQGGTSVTLIGTNFTNATSVTFGGTEATDLSVLADDQITVTTPVRLSGGAVDVVVTTPAGSGTAEAGYLYESHQTTPGITVLGPLVLNPETGLYEQTVRITNPVSIPLAGFRLSVTNLPTGARLVNGTHPFLPVIEDPETLPGYAYRDVLVVYDLAGTSRSWEPDYVVQNLDQDDLADLPALDSGRYHALVGRSKRPLLSLKANLGGRLDMTLTAGGTLTGKIVEGGRNIAFKGRVTLGGENRVQPMVEVSLPKVNAMLRLFFSESGDALAGELTGKFLLTQKAEINGWRNVWTDPVTASAQTVPAADYRAVHNFKLGTVIGPVPVDDAAPVPQGFGFGTIRPVGSARTFKGGYRATGRLADGSAFTCASFFGPEGQVLIYRKLYNQRGSLLGLMQVLSGPDAPQDNAVVGGLSWLKKARVPMALRERLYGQGFETELAAAGGTYVPAAAGEIVMGLEPVAGAEGNAWLDFQYGGLEGSFSQELRIASRGPRSVVNWVTPLKPNVSRLKMSVFNAKTGAFAGSWDSSLRPTRRAKFRGMMVQVRDDAWQQQPPSDAPSTMEASGYGYFLLPQAADVGPIQILSGELRLQGKLK